MFETIVNNVFKHCTNTTQSTPFNFSFIIQCAEYTARNRVYKGMMITHHKNHLHIIEINECIHPKQRLAQPPSNTLHSTNISEPPKDSLLLPGTCSTTFHDCIPQHLSVPSVTSFKSFKSLCHFISTTSYSYKCLMETGITNKSIHQN